MRKALTDKALDALKPQAKRYEVHDLYCPGLSVRVSPEGRKSFSVKYRYGIKQKRLTIGIYPRMPLANPASWGREACALENRICANRQNSLPTPVPSAEQYVCVTGDGKCWQKSLS